MNIKITKITDESLLQRANAATTGRDSFQTLDSAYAHKHTTIRTQIYFVECRDIPQSVAYHLRTHFTLFPMPPFEMAWMRSKRPDRGGEDFRAVVENLTSDLTEAFDLIDDSAFNQCVEELKTLPDRFGRTSPTDFSFLISAEGLMTMAEKRLCLGAVSRDTRLVMEAIIVAIKDVDANLAPYLVKPCVATGICRERCCGYINSVDYGERRDAYKRLFQSRNTNTQPTKNKRV